MKKTLELNFRSAARIQPCLDALKHVSPTPFTHAGPRPPSWRQMATMPEYAEVNAQVVLTFATPADCHQFMNTPACRETYQKFAGETDG
jgi:hypothetical protein